MLYCQYSYVILLVQHSCTFGIPMLHFRYQGASLDSNALFLVGIRIV